MENPQQKAKGASKGFTLIELLVVIAIIGLLSTLAIVALGTARLKSRDARRVADLKSIQTALELYYSDLGGYPVTSSVQLGDTNHACLDSTGFHVANSCVNAYIATIPKDPKGGYYSYTGVANNYKVLASLEGMVNSLSGQISVSPNSSVGADQVVLSLPFDKPGCYPSGSALGTLGEQVAVIRNSTSTYIDTNGVLQTCLANQLRVTPSGALVEPGATNLAISSEQIGTGGGWFVRVGTTATANQAVAPNNVTSAASIAWLSGDGYVWQNRTWNPSTNYTVSVWAKIANGSPTLRLVNWDGVTSYNSSTLLTTAWVRYTITFTTAAGANFGDGGFMITNGSAYLFGYQLETGPVATSYIATGATTVTRNADLVSVANPLTTTNNQYSIAGTYAYSGRVWSSSGGVNEFLWGTGSLGANSAYAWNWAGAVSFAMRDNLNTARTRNGPSPGSGSHRFVFVWDGIEPSTYFDGVSVGSLSGAQITGLSAMSPTLYLGSNGGGAAFGGTISNFLICNTGTYGQGGCQ